MPTQNAGPGFYEYQLKAEFDRTLAWNITKDGCESLSAEIPRSIEEFEEFIK